MGLALSLEVLVSYKEVVPFEEDVGSEADKRARPRRYGPLSQVSGSTSLPGLPDSPIQVIARRNISNLEKEKIRGSAISTQQENLPKRASSWWNGLLLPGATCRGLGKRIALQAPRTGL